MLSWPCWYLPSVTSAVNTPLCFLVVSAFLARLVACSECPCFLLTACANVAYTGADANCHTLSLVSRSLLAVLQPHGPLPESAAALPWIPPALPDTTNQVGFRDPLQRPLCRLLCQVPFKKVTTVRFSNFEIIRNVIVSFMY